MAGLDSEDGTLDDGGGEVEGEREVDRELFRGEVVFPSEKLSVSSRTLSMYGCISRSLHD